MEMMKKVALRHGLVCLLHEKPFDGVNGSGKHNNWALSTDSGINLLEPGNDPENNVRFLLLLVAVMKAVDKYAELLRMSVATPGNDHRLGAAEAPPAIVSIFLGDELTAIFDAIEKDEVYNKHERVLMEIGASVLPHFPKDTTDRNRTSPFAFTGNKFEFRMLGASSSISGPNVVLNTAVADVLGEFADILENAEDFDKALHDLIRDTIKNHRRIVFDGNNYSKEWIEEANRRGLPNISSAAEAIKWYKSKKSVDLFTKHNIFTETELISRCEIHQDHYCKIIHIEALTMIEMVRHEILPSAMKYSSVLAESAYKKNKIGIQADFEMDLCRNISAYLVKINGLTDKLEKTLDGVKANDNAEKASEYCHNRVTVEMKQLREAVDALEPLMDKEYMPYPDYGTLMFGV